MKNFKKILSAAFAAIIVAAGSMAVADAIKVTDPTDPRFNPDEFKFTDYKNPDELVVIYKKIFPIGTSKEFVDRVLVKAGGARCARSKTFEKLWSCRKPRNYNDWEGLGAPFSLIFDNKMRLLNINNGAEEIYPNSVTWKDLEEEYKKNLRTEKDHE